MLQKRIFALLAVAALAAVALASPAIAQITHPQDLSGSEHRFRVGPDYGSRPYDYFDGEGTAGYNYYSYPWARPRFVQPPLTTRP
jgi:opacity protein-like surface antigen